MSVWTTSTLSCGATTSRSAGMRLRSNSTATTRRARAASAIVSVPTPAPTSRTSSSRLASAASAIASRRDGSTRKFWPRWCWRVIRCRRSRDSRSPLRAGSKWGPREITALAPISRGSLSLHLGKEGDGVGALLVGELLHADAAQLGHDLRRVDEVRRAVGHAHPFLRVAVRRVRLQQQAVGRASLDDLAQLVAAR